MENQKLIFKERIDTMAISYPRKQNLIGKKLGFYKVSATRNKSVVSSG